MNDIISYEINKFNFKEAFDKFFEINYKDIDQHKLLDKIENRIECKNTEDIFNKIKDRLGFNFAESTNCKIKPNTVKLEIKEDNKVYYNYIIGQKKNGELLNNKLYFRIGTLSDEEIKEYFRNNRRCQIEWEAGIKHTMLCNGLNILFSGILIFDKDTNKLKITPISGQWGTNIMLLLEKVTFNKNIENYQYKKYEDVATFLGTKDVNMKRDIQDLNCLNIICTYYVLSRLIKKTGGRKKKGGTILNSIDIDIEIDGECFKEHYDNIDYNNISSDCKEDIPYFKSSRILIDGIKDILINSQRVNYNESLLNILARYTITDQINIFKNKYGEDYNKTIIDILEETGGIAKIQMIMCAINKKINEQEKKKSQRKSENPSTNQVLKRQRRGGRSN
jgi:hypothetical protein